MLTEEEREQALKRAHRVRTGGTGELAGGR